MYIYIYKHMNYAHVDLGVAIPACSGTWQENPDLAGKTLVPYRYPKENNRKTIGKWWLNGI